MIKYSGAGWTRYTFMFFGRFGFGQKVSVVSKKGSKSQKNGNVYGKWLVMSRTGLKNPKNNGQVSFVNLYVLNKYTKRTTKNKNK